MFSFLGIFVLQKFQEKNIQKIQKFQEKKKAG
jgi:hypothetical protein